MSSLEIFFTTLGMAAIALACRAFFLVPKDDLPMPLWLREGLRYAPVAALAAVVAPELVMTQGQLIDTWRDARIFGALRLAGQPVRHHRLRHGRDAGAAVRAGLVARPGPATSNLALVRRGAHVSWLRMAVWNTSRPTRPQQHPTP